MLDYNHRPGIAERINAAVDAALEADRAATPPRDYLGASRLGHACERALQFEFAGAPKDEGQDFSGRSLRIFAIGHELEDLAIRWLRAAGLDLYTRKGNCPDGEQFGFSVAVGRIRGHVDGIVAAAPAALGLRTLGIYWVGNVVNAGPLGRSRHRVQLAFTRACAVCGVDITQVGWTAERCAHDDSIVADVPAGAVLADVRALLADARDEPRRQPAGAVERGGPDGQVG